MTLARAVDDYLRHVQIERGLSANTVSAYRRDLAGYVEWLESAGIDEPRDVLATHVTGYARALSRREDRPLGPSSLARVLSSVRGFHRFLLEERDVDGDVARDVRPPKLGRRLPKALTIDQVERLLAATEGEDVAALRDHALLELLYATGARVSEVVGLNVDDVIDEDIVRLTGKGDKQRIVPLGRYARTAVDAYLVRGRPVLSAMGVATPALFLGMRGARLSRQSAWLILQAAAERAGLTAHVSPHTLRHSFATHLLQGGADVRVVQELLGHSSVATTQIYTLVTADSLRDVYTAAHPRAR
ncbi:site-specific tyrosine recombinase XerD [Labedella populi]|uniref:Tyrosine recombinase XerD n=1 Tax=Labedella populi TaxID=2498850 RepID=A0A444QGN9_9MICO|nr:site-specific tyrosine recombinase XerD [Labedella populi]RWZ68751.1 site-specific tyrosine recombinase XerD [Labedella populi]